MFYIMKRKAGQPTKYREAMCDRIVELGRKGYSRAMMACDIGISKDSWYRFIKKHPKFCEAVKVAEQASQAWWELQGMNSLYAEKFNSSSFIFQMKNRFRGDYGEKREHTIKIDNGLPSKSDLKKLSNEQITQHIAGYIEGKSDS